MAEPSPPALLGLCDMPDPWMQPLAHLADSASILALMRTCRPMRNLALTERPSYVRLPLPFLQSEAAALIDKLQLACRYASKVHLRLTLDRAVQGYHLWCASGYQLMYGASAALALKAGAGGIMPLTGITNVELEEMPLAELVPAWLTLTCPNMTELGLTSCHLGELAAPTRAIHQCNQLQRLQMKYCTAQPASVSNWQHALRALPSLTQLHSETSGNNHSELPTLEMCSAIGAQLTSLRIWAGDFTEANSVRRLREVQQLAAWFPSLRDLRLPVHIVNDSVMRALLKLPPCSLQRFECTDFQLEQSYTTSPWVHLHVSNVSVCALSRLHWEGVGSISTGSLDLRAANSGDVMNARQHVEYAKLAATAIASCGGIRWPDRPPQRYSFAALHAEGLDSAGLAAILPLLKGTPAAGLAIDDGEQLTKELLEAMALHLPRHLQTVGFKACTWAPGALRHLLPSMPANVRIIFLDGRLSEAQAIMMCAAAVRPVELKLQIQPPPPQAEWRARLQGVMQEAGHQHVRVTFMEHA